MQKWKKVLIILAVAAVVGGTIWGIAENKARQERYRQEAYDAFRNAGK